MQWNYHKPFLLICLSGSIMLSACSPKSGGKDYAADKKQETAKQNGRQEEKDQPTSLLSENQNSLLEIVPADIGISNAPYPTNDFGELLMSDDFDQTIPTWQTQNAYKLIQEGGKTLGVFRSENDQVNQISLDYVHERNVVYKLKFQLRSGFCNFVINENDAAGSRLFIIIFRKEDNFTLRLNMDEQHGDQESQVGEVAIVSDDGWVEMQVRQFDRYMDIFANGRHIISFKLPDEMLAEKGIFKMAVYDPFGGGAELVLDFFQILEAKPENVFLDTIPLARTINESETVHFKDLEISRVERQVPDRVQTEDGWLVDYFIAPSEARSPNDLEITDDGEIVVLQQRNWGLRTVGLGKETQWYLDTKKEFGELVTNGILDRDRSGNLYLISAGQVYQIDAPGSAKPIFQLNGHSANVTQSPLDGALYFIEDGKIKRWINGRVEVVVESFGGYGQLVFTDDGTPYYFPWGNSNIYELIPETFEVKQLIFCGDLALPDVEPTSFSRISTLGNSLVMTFNSEVMRIDPQTGEVDLLASGFNQLEGISTGSDGQVCFVSRFDSGVYCWQEGEIMIASMPTFLMTPMGIVVNSVGEVYSGNDEATHLFKYDSQGNYLQAFDVNVCQAPMVDLAVDDRDNVYVSAGEFFTSTSELVRISPQDEVEVLVAYPEIRYASGIDWYDGNVYVVEVESGILYRLEADDSLTAFMKDIPSPKKDGTIPMRIDRDGNFYLFITANKEMQLYQVTMDGKWTALDIGLDQRSLTVIEYWPERNALLIGMSDFWNENGQLILYDLEKGSTSTLLSGVYAVSGIAHTPDGDILVSDDWDNCIYRLALENK